MWCLGRIIGTGSFKKSHAAASGRLKNVQHLPESLRKSQEVSGNFNTHQERQEGSGRLTKPVRASLRTLQKASNVWSSFSKLPETADCSRKSREHQEVLEPSASARKPQDAVSGSRKKKPQEAPRMSRERQKVPGHPQEASGDIQSFRKLQQQAPGSRQPTNRPDLNSTLIKGSGVEMTEPHTMLNFCH